MHNAAPVFDERGGAYASSQAEMSARGRPPDAAPTLSARMDCVRTGSRSDDDQLVSRLLAPPDLEEGVQSLGYWWGRSRRLPWYRLKARREAARMTARWEQRVRARRLSYGSR